MSTATRLPEFQDLADGPGELGPADDGKVPAWSWPDRRLLMIPLPGAAERQLIIRAGGGGGGGVTDHADLTNLDYANSGHTGFEPAGAGVAAVADHVAESNPHGQYLLIVDYAPEVETEIAALERLLEAAATVTVERQIAVLMRLGYSAADATSVVAQASAITPTDMDLMTWLPSAELLDTPLSGIDILQARLDWYATAPAKYQRLLDAGLRNG